MFQAARQSMKWVGRASLAILAWAGFAARDANADPCAAACRSQHNSCRMSAKLLYASHCDAQLQSCITQCFAGARGSRNSREGRPHDMRDREPRGIGEPRDLRGPPRERP